MTDKQTVILRAEIKPAFSVTVIDDSTGKGWSGHTWYGHTALDALRNMRNTMHMGDYKNEEIRVTSSTPELIAAVSWKEPEYK